MVENGVRRPYESIN